MRKRTWMMGLVLAAALGLTACGNSDTGTETTSGNQNQTEAAGETASESQSAGTEGTAKTDLVIAVATEAVTLDPQGGWDGASLYLLRQMYNGLVKLDQNMEIVGDLAESWEFTSDTSVTFKLKQGVKFHNGEEMKASDVVYSIERAQASAKVKTFAANIESVTADDDYTVTINTTIPYAPLMSNLCHTACSIVSQKAAEEAGDQFSTQPVGTGPFKFVSWESGDKIVLEKNADYFAGDVLPTSLTFKLMSEDSSRTIALETGEVDLNLVVSAQDAERVESAENLKLTVAMSPKIEYVSMNQKVSPFDNVLVRQAINYAIDREALNLVATAGYGEVTDSVMNNQIMGWTDDVAHYEYNPEKAKELLAEAGYPDGFSTSILVGTNARSTEAQLIQGNLSEIGITLDITTMESATMLEQINNGDYEMFIMSYNNTTGDPDTSLYMLFNSAVPASSGNRAFVNIPEVDEMLEAARLEIDSDARMEIYGNVQKTLTEEAVWVPLYNVPSLVGTQKSLEGYVPHPLGNDVFDQLHYAE